MADTTSTVPRVSSKQIPWGAAAVVALAALLLVLVLGYRPDTDPTTEIGSLIRCPVCQGVPISDSPAPMARDMMSILRQELDEGATREEAIESVLGAYPGSLLLEPRLTPATLALWLVPALALVAGGGLAFTVRRSRRGADDAPQRGALEQSRQQIRSDIDELATQEAAGDIDPDAAAHLRNSYLAELAETDAALASTPETPGALPRSPRRVAAGAALVVSALALVVIAAGAFLVDRPDSTSGVAGLTGDASDFSNETLAAVIAANADHPQIDGMRMALADRYFEAGDYQSAFPHYFEVAESESASDTQAATALTRLGWMAYDGNGEADAALDLMGQARRLAPDDPFPLYLVGVVNWCEGNTSGAVSAFREVLQADLGEAEIQGEVEADLTAVEAGEPCDR